MDVNGEYDFFKKILKNNKFKHLKLTDTATEKELDNLNSENQIRLIF